MMDTSYILEWLSLLTRWTHVIVGIAWIGASFYFVLLDYHLLPPSDQTRQNKGVGGERMAVHGGGTLHVLVRATRTADPRLLTCHSALPEPPMTIELLELADEPGP